VTKDELREYRSLKTELGQLNDEKTRLRSIAENCVRSMGQIKTSSGHDPLPGIMDKLSEVDEKLLPRLKKSADMLVRIETSIDGLPAQERVLIRAYYIEGKRWEQVADEVGYSVRQIHYIHGNALRKIGRGARDNAGAE